MKITIGSDHKGYSLKCAIKKELGDKIELIDVGTDSQVRTDYPIYAKKVCNNILEGKTDFGILICGSGIGMSIAANRHDGIYAALCWNEQVAKLAKADDNSNILVLPSDFLTSKDSFAIIHAWLYTEFKCERYLDRLKLIDKK
ncbi:ribose 5-phosphate isomerase B [Candidatus Dependentiae bacterium]